ncbi:DUF3488 domain-containing protein [Deefgea sp. CFH1-16]|uniref:DUF3488 domain-containing protein n=1 Tax=Deefgea sp. CFH1-16 TaxID=2675457 RepID=UPI0035B3368C
MTGNFKLAPRLSSPSKPHGREGGIAVLIALCISKLYETRTVRDAHAMLLLAFFATGISFLHGQAPWQAALAGLALVATVCIALRLENNVLTLGISIKAAVKICLQAIPLAALLFLFYSLDYRLRFGVCPTRLPLAPVYLGTRCRRAA